MRLGGNPNKGKTITPHLVKARVVVARTTQQQSHLEYSRWTKHKKTRIKSKIVRCQDSFHWIVMLHNTLPRFLSSQMMRIRGFLFDRNSDFCYHIPYI